MGKQESPVELPPMYINHDEREAVTSLCARYGGYGGYTGWEVAYRRECQLREALAQLRTANERGERAERELEEERELCDAIAQQRQHLELQVTKLEAKLVAPPEPPPSLLEEMAEALRVRVITCRVCDEGKCAGCARNMALLARYKDAR